MLETVDVGTQNLDLYELTSEKAQMAKLKRVRRTSLLGTWVNKSHKKRKGSAPNQVATALSRARRKTRTALLTATPARSQTNPPKARETAIQNTDSHNASRKGTSLASRWSTKRSRKSNASTSPANTSRAHSGNGGATIIPTPLWRHPPGARRPRSRFC